MFHVLDNRSCRRVVILAGSLGAVACGGNEAAVDKPAAAAHCDEARRTVETLGERMRSVSLLAPDTIVARELSEAYGELVSPGLLASWKTTPANAPGRAVSNPWPARIEVSRAEAVGDQCRVEARVIYVTTSDTLAAVERRPVTVRLDNDGGWRVTGFEVAAPTASATGGAGASPAQVVRRYYSAIAAGQYDSAYSLWSDHGRSSHQSREAFARGFAETARVRVSVGDSVHIEGAAGSQYATVPVDVDAELRNGEQQRFTGTYTLRRAMVDGATEEQRQWHIYSADLHSR